jgi:D-arabinose 1-dehydrogenase-like Zn-dependent alcohol dehydrogenase
MGNHTTVISRGTAKKDSALNDLKAHQYIDSTNQAELDAAAGSLDFILDTVSAQHSIPDLLKLLKTDGKLILVGAPSEPLDFGAFALLMGRKIISGSGIGGIRETQEMLDFCGRHNIVCDIELIKADKINEAYVRTLKSDVKYRFVIDTATI